METHSNCAPIIISFTGGYIAFALRYHGNIRDRAIDLPFAARSYYYYYKATRNYYHSMDAKRAVDGLENVCGLVPNIYQLEEVFDDKQVREAIRL